MTAPEAEQLWGLQPGTVRAACGRGIITCRKSAGTWLVTRQEMEAHYGNATDNKQINADAESGAFDSTALSVGE